MTEKNNPTKATVTERDTKSVIFDAYTKLLKEKQDQGNTNMNVDVKVKKEKEATVVKEVGNKASVLVGFSNSIVQRVQDYENLIDGIAIKENELKELFSIEKEAYTLAALIDANEVVKKELEVNMAERMKKLQADLSEVVTDINLARKIGREEKEREEKEWHYSFERMKIKKTDEMKDALAVMEKEVKATLEEAINGSKELARDLNEREENIVSQEDAIKALKEEVEKMPDVIAAAVKAEVGKEKGMLENKAKAEQKYFERDISARLELATSTIGSMTADNTEMKQTIASLQDKLEVAYREVKDVAIKTVEGAGSSAMFQELKGLLTEGKSGK